MPNRLRALTALTALFLVLGAVPALADEVDEPEAPETEETVETEDEGSHLNGKFLMLFAEGFDADEEDLAAFADMGLGWGDVFKLNLYSTVLGVPVDELLAGTEFDDETGEYDFAWGELKQSLTDEQLALLESMPRNFGQFVSADKRHHGRDQHQPDRNERPDKTDNPNKPDHAGKGGRSGK